MIEFVIYGNSVYQVNRCLSIFAEVIRAHQDEIHQTAIEWYDERKSEWKDESELSLETPVRESASNDEPLEQFYDAINDELYIKEYIRYIDDPEGEVREVIDNRNTQASTQL